jgi:hypothetical protein
MAWRTARSIQTLFDQLERAAPAAAPHGSGGVQPDEWGTIGDAVHDPSSDHSPKNFPGLGQQVVTAGDFPNRPDLGLDAHRVLDNIRHSHDARVKYGISNDQIFSSYATANRAAWTWGPYNPNDPNRDRHRTHGHLSVVGDARADGTQPWQIGGVQAAADTEEDDMGQSFGPVQLEQGTTSLVIPPVQAGVADPRRVWLNIGGDLGDDKAAVRVWASDGEGNWSPVSAIGPDGVGQLTNGKVISAELAKGVRLISITRVPATGATAVFPRSLSACFERQ